MTSTSALIAFDRGDIFGGTRGMGSPEIGALRANADVDSPLELVISVLDDAHAAVATAAAVSVS